MSGRTAPSWIVTSLGQLDEFFLANVPAYGENGIKSRQRRISSAVSVGMYTCIVRDNNLTGFAIYEPSTNNVHVPWLAGEPGFLSAVLADWRARKPTLTATAYRRGKLVKYHGRHTKIR